jgi:glutamyl-Q tRNA(Asp) synthetase
VAEREAEGPWPRDPDGAPLYPGSARALSEDERARRMQAGEPYALRLDMAAAVSRVGALTSQLTWQEERSERAETVAADPAAWGDVVLARKETPTSYHVSVVVDDAAQGVTEVVRGRDLFAATSVHRLLQALLGLREPVYLHHRLIVDADGNKLSKSTQATGLRELRARGVAPAEIRYMVGLGG